MKESIVQCFFGRWRIGQHDASIVFMALAPIVRRFFDVIRLRRWGAVGLSLLLAWPGSGGWSGGGLWSERRRAETAAPHTEGFWSALPVSRGVPGSGPSASVSAPRGARAIVDANTHFADPEVLARVSTGLGEAMVGIEIDTLPAGALLQTRGA